MLAVLAAALLALLPRAALAAPSGDAGAPPAVSTDGGTSASAAAAAAPVDTGDGGAPATTAPAPTEPSIHLPPTAAEQAEGLPIAGVEIAGNRRV
ncbi:MAG: outer membrane protein assembly factor BamA, partial [Gemmatimonadales bacterium]